LYQKPDNCGCFLKNAGFLRSPEPRMAAGFSGDFFIEKSFTFFEKTLAFPRQMV